MGVGVAVAGVNAAAVGAGVGNAGAAWFDGDVGGTILAGERSELAGGLSTRH